MPEPIKLNQFCVKILNGILAAPGWATPGQAWTAGEVLETVLLPIDLPQEPQMGQPETAEHRAWAAVPVSLTVTDRQRVVITACAKHFAEAKALPPVYHLRPLLELAGLKPEA